MWWGFHCYPTLRVVFATFYYMAAATAVLASLSAKSVLWRAVPMAALMVTRFAITGTRFALGAGSHAATWHYIYMEVRMFSGSAQHTNEVELETRLHKRGGSFTFA